MTKQIVAYQGIKGAYSYIASKYLFPEAELVGKGSFEAVYQTLVEDKADLLVLPIENTLVGSIFEVYDLMFQHDDIQILGEITLRVDHNLLAVSDDIEELTQVYSHPKALGQCQQLFTQFPNIIPVVWEDTAAAAAYVSLKQDPAVGAIASLSAAEAYGLKIVKPKVQSNQANYTRFVVVGKRGRGHHANSATLLKTSLEFVAAHQPGALLRCLEPVGSHNLNMSKIESRPLVGSPFQYLFYLDFEHTSKLNGKLEEILAEIKPHTQILRHLGTYPRGVTIAEQYQDKHIQIVEI